METRSAPRKSHRVRGRSNSGRRRLRVLVIDVGGSRVKILATGRSRPAVVPSGPRFTPQAMVSAIKEATAGWQFDVVSLGYPGMVVGGKPAEDPPNLGQGWRRFNFAKAFGRPVKLVNDAVMQALGSYRGGTMLFLSLGTGLGSTLVLNGILHPMELGDLPYQQGRTYAAFIGKRLIPRLGKKRWEKHALTAIRQLSEAIRPEYTVVGGGEASLLGKLPRGVIRGDNSKAFVGGFRLWERYPFRRHRGTAKLRPAP